VIPSLAMAGELFRGIPGRTYWRRARGFRHATQTLPADAGFHAIVEDEWQQAMKIEPKRPLS
jgi:hypothetical protein